MSLLAQPFIDYLKQLQQKGETHVHLDEQAKLVLREFYLRAKGIKPAPATTAPSAPAKTTPTASHSINIDPAPAPAATTSITISGTSKAEKLESLRQLTLNWKPLNSLTTLRKTPVFFSGDPNAKLMFIGEAPSYHDEKKQQPFSGPAGDKLNGILKAMGLSRQQVFITHMVKYRPAMENQTTGNRKPSREEIRASLRLLLEEIKIVQPAAIVILGATAAQAILGTSEDLDSLRGKPHSLAGTKSPITRVTYHPSYLLNNQGNDAKRKLWEDMLAVMEQIDLPISEKQRNYFTSK